MAVSLASRCAAPLSVAAERGLKPKDSFKECDNCPEMVVVPAGSFTMGSPASEKDRDKNEGPQRIVTIRKSFAVGRFHVTVAQFAAFVAETGHDAGSSCFEFDGGKWEEKQGRSWRDPGFAQGASHPAVCLSWNDAKAYVAWMARKTGKAYRLLTEAEWEYAARAHMEPGAYPRYWFGNDDKDLCHYGNGADQTAKRSMVGKKNWVFASCDDGYAYTSPVGSFAGNGLGLYDMVGNAWQWTEDCYHANYRGAPMPLHGQPATAVVGSFAAVPGSTFRQTFVRPIAAEMFSRAEIMFSVSALEGRLLVDPQRAGTRAS